MGIREEETRIGVTRRRGRRRKGKTEKGDDDVERRLEISGIENKTRMVTVSLEGSGGGGGVVCCRQQIQGQRRKRRKC